jgi:hypothetical protein
MKRYYLGLVAVVALFAGLGFSQPEPTQAYPSYIKVGQANVQLAINFAIYCPGGNQNIAQSSINVAILNADVGVDQITAAQTNVQVAYNFAINSPGMTQGIEQEAVNYFSTFAQANDLKYLQQNVGNQINFEFQSPGTYQGISQTALNNLSVASGSPTLTSALAVVIRQTNLAMSLGVCAPAPVANQVAGWAAQMFAVPYGYPYPFPGD